MPTRNVSLAAEQDAFAERMVKSGEYQNVSEAIRFQDTKTAKLHRIYPGPVVQAKLCANSAPMRPKCTFRLALYGRIRDSYSPPAGGRRSNSPTSIAISNARLTPPAFLPAPRSMTETFLSQSASQPRRPAQNGPGFPQL